MRNRGLASQETPQEHMSIVRWKISFQHQASIRKTNTFSTCFYTSFLSVIFLFAQIFHIPIHIHTQIFTPDTYSLNQLTKQHKFPEISILGSYRFILLVRSNALVRTTTSFWRHCRGTSFYLENQIVFRCLFFIIYYLIIC